jgi:restriction system protein
MHHPGAPVDVPELRDFLLEIAAQRLAHGTFATSSSFTPEALDFASDSGFSALDGGSLLAMIERRTPQQQRALLAAACAAED